MKKGAQEKQSGLKLAIEKRYRCKRFKGYEITGEMKRTRCKERKRERE